MLDPIQERGQAAAAALERLCEIYRQPLVQCARHLLGEDNAEAEDLVHDYLWTLLRRDDLAKLHREKGRFRAFLAAGIRHQVINFIHARRALKRGGGLRTESLDEAGRDLPDPSTAEMALCRSWIEASIAEVLRQMEEDWRAADKASEFAQLKEFALSKKNDVPRTQLAAEYGVSLNAIDAKISRFRRRFREQLRALIAQTVARPDEVDEEIAYLMSVLAN